MDLFKQPLDDVSLPVNTSSTGTKSGVGEGQLIPAFICVLEGWKTKIKNLHWAAPNMNTHKLLDEIADFVNDFQDSLAEDYMGQNGKFSSSFLKGSPCNSNTTKDLLKDMCSKTKVFYEKTPEKTIYKGIKSETESFIHNINKYLYLIDLCE